MGRRRPDPSRVALVTGGGSGIGEATCHHLSEHGHRVAVVDIDGDAAERVAKAVEADGGSAIAVRADVTDRRAIDAALATTVAGLGEVEVLVTSAGVCPFTPFADITPEEWHLAIDVNLTGTFHCCQAALPPMVDARWGRLVLISSSSGQRGAVRAPHYAAAKGGVITLARSLAMAYAPHGITVNAIAPSGIETPMQHAAQAAGHLPANEVMAGAVPLGHLGTADDIAAAVAFLASDEAGFITGQTLGVNGGQVL
ncbi:MAG TPA: SDR family NAD(P)-dependent oxidoreductase [Acidimicrobiales bacterium]|nr:SDR family NAD(P)-dependent oxidoreductase [Acidimicrobiales bacterium]